MKKRIVQFSDGGWAAQVKWPLLGWRFITSTPNKYTYSPLSRESIRDYCVVESRDAALGILEKQFSKSNPPLEITHCEEI